MVEHISNLWKLEDFFKAPDDGFIMIPFTWNHGTIICRILRFLISESDRLATSLLSGARSDDDEENWGEFTGDVSCFSHLYCIRVSEYLIRAETW